MAKKVTATPSASNVFSFDDLNSFLTKEVKSGGEIISKMKFEETEFIPSGIHVLDALTSARVIGGGIASNRFTVIAGPSACLFPEEKINIYVMKTKKDNRNIYEQKPDNTFSRV